MDGNLEDICERLSLTKFEQKAIQIDYGQLFEVIAKGTNYPLAKLHSVRPYNKEAFKAIMKKIWKPTRLMKFHELVQDLMMVEFEDASYKRIMIRENPWSFNRSLVLFKEFEGTQQACNVNITKASF